MTDESICAGCAELVRVQVDRVKRRVCSVEGLRDVIGIGDTVQECSRFVGAPKVRSRDQGIKIVEGRDGRLAARPRYLP